MNKFPIHSRVVLYQTGDKLLNEQHGEVVGYDGDFISVVAFDTIPIGYNPVICIIHECLMKEVS